MPNASQMRCRDATDGVIFFRNQEEIVVCAMPDSNDNRYSVHPRSFFNWRIRSSTGLGDVYKRQPFSYIIYENPLGF